jgi:tetratricopeptide (TPR) repeat protein/transcriptional regulator with XRE-family HTH domain
VFGGIVRANRVRLSITQEELAGKTGLGVRTVRGIETGRIATPRQGTVRLLAEAFGLGGAERDRFYQAARAGTDTVDRDRRPVPAQLPADVAGFTGRTDQLRRLTAALDGYGDGPGPVMITAVAGTAGVGKTALAVHWAHRVAHRFPDGQLYVNLRGFDPALAPMRPAEAVRGFLDALGVRPERIPIGLDAQASLYRSLLAGRRVLVVLDNARDADQVRPLLPGSPSCLVVVTSRSRLVSLVATEGAMPIALDLPSLQEARELVTRRLGADRVAADRDTIEEIIVRCARLPLALTVVAARAAIDRVLPLAALAGQLRHARDRLDALAGDDAASDVRAVLSWSYRQLDAPAARMFRLLGVHPGPDIGIPAAASLAAVPAERAHALLTDLADLHLVVEHAPGRFAFHDLLRAYAAELAEPPERRAALGRVLDHYLHAADSAAGLLHPTRVRVVDGTPPAGVTAEELVDADRALHWFIRERPVLMAAVECSASAGFSTHTGQLAWTMEPFLERRGHWHELLAVQRIALDTARRGTDRVALARGHWCFGWACHRLGRREEALAHLRRALDLYADLDDPVARANVHVEIAIVLDRPAHAEQALWHLRRALDLFRSAGHPAGEARALNNLGWNYALLGEYQRAIEYCTRALRMHREAGNRLGEVATWDSLGYANHHLGNLDRAIACYQRALDLDREAHDRKFEADILSRLGDAQRDAGEAGAARSSWRNALAIFDDLDHPDADALRAKLGREDSRPR